MADIQSLERQMTDLAGRVREVEAAVVRQDQDAAVRRAQAAHIDGRFDRIEKRLDKGDGNISRLIWIIGAAILSAFVGFIVKGGLNVPAI